MKPMFDGIVVLREVPIYNGHSETLGEIDRLVIDTVNKKIDVYELKSRKTARTIIKGTTQIEKELAILPKMFPDYILVPHLVYQDRGNENV